MKKILIFSVLVSSLFALSPYEQFKQGGGSHSQMGKGRAELNSIDKSGDVEQVRKRYLDKIASKKRTAPSMMRVRISGIESCIKSAPTVAAIDACVPSMMK